MKKTIAQLEEELKNPHIGPAQYRVAMAELEQVRVAEKEAPMDDSYAQTFSHDYGQRVQQDLLRRYHPARSRFHDENGNYDPDPIRAAMRDGAASVVMYIQKRLNRAPNYHLPVE